MTCSQCGSGDVSFLKVKNEVKIYVCNTCETEFVLQGEVE